MSPIKENEKDTKSNELFISSFFVPQPLIFTVLRNIFQIKTTTWMINGGEPSSSLEFSINLLLDFQ